MSKRAQLAEAVKAGMTRAEQSVMVWGADDCALWVADILQPVVGYDPAAKVRGRYKSRRGSIRITGRAGLVGQFRAIARRHQWKRIHPTLAQAGDVGLAWTSVDEKPVLATVVCAVSGWFVGRNEGGWTGIRASKIAASWSILDDALPASPLNVSLRRISLRPDLCPTSAVAHEPVSVGFAILSLLSITGASAAVAGVVGFVVTTAISCGIFIQPKVRTI